MANCIVCTYQTKGGEGLSCWFVSEASDKATTLTDEQLDMIMSACNNSYMPELVCTLEKEGEPLHKLKEVNNGYSD